MRHFRIGFYSKKGANFGQISKVPLVRYSSPNAARPAISASSPPSICTTRTKQRPDSADLIGCAPARRCGSELYEHQPPFPSTASIHSSPPRHSHRISYLYLITPFTRIAHRLTKGRRQRAEDLEEYKRKLEAPVPDFVPHNHDDDTCPICLSEYEDGDLLRLLPCNHFLHQSCVDEWLHINRTCPLCKRTAIPGESDEEGSIEHTHNPADLVSSDCSENGSGYMQTTQAHDEDSCCDSGLHRTHQSARIQNFNVDAFSIAVG